MGDPGGQGAEGGEPLGLEQGFLSLAQRPIGRGQIPRDPPLAPEQHSERKANLCQALPQVNR